MRSIDVPQANDLSAVRAVVSAVAGGAREATGVRVRTGYSRRHCQYRLHAARILGLLDYDGEQLVALTALGQRLVDTPTGGQRERHVLHDAISRSAILQQLAPDLLAPQPPTLEDLSGRLCTLAGLSPHTADRRAAGLYTWRRKVLNEPAPPPESPPPGPAQLSLF